MSAVKVDVGPLYAARGGTLVVTYHEPVASGIDEVPFVEPVEGTLTLVNLGAVLQVTGRMTTRADLTCDRCAAVFRRRLEATVEEELPWPLTAGRADPGGQAPGTYLLGAGDRMMLDVDALARDALVLALPMVALCAPDCPGLCPRCGADLKTEACRCEVEHTGEAAVDPRLQVLTSWRRQLPPS